MLFFYLVRNVHFDETINKCICLKAIEVLMVLTENKLTKYVCNKQGVVPFMKFELLY